MFRGSYLLVLPWQKDQSGFLCGTKVQPPPYQAEMAFLGAGPSLAVCFSAQIPRCHLCTFSLKNAGLQVNPFILLSGCSQTLSSAVAAESLTLWEPAPFLQSRVWAAVGQRHSAARCALLHLQTFTQQLVLNLQARRLCKGDTGEGIVWAWTS